jgi:type I restriction enzyme S subunit
MSCARLESGHTPSRYHPEWWGGQVPWISLTDIRELDGKVAHETREYTNEAGIANSAARVLPADTVVLSRTASVGFVTIMGREMSTSQDFVNWVCGPDLDPQFLAYLFRASRAYLRSLSSGAIHQTIYMPTVEAFEVCIPDLKEQKRIVCSLGEQMAAVERARVAAEAQLEAAKALPAVYLRSAFASSEAQRWPLRPLGDLCEIQLGKMLSPVSRGGASPLPYLRNANVQWDHLDLTSISKMDFEADELVKFELRPGDLLVCEGGEPGRAAVWDGRIAPCYYQKALHRLRVRTGVAIPQFIMYRLWFGSVSEEFGESHAKTTIAHLPAVRLTALAIRVPAVSEQRRIVDRLAAEMAAVVHMGKVVEGHLSALNALSGALLRRAFSGEL